jgi:hypothetical protein
MVAHRAPCSRSALIEVMGRAQSTLGGALITHARQHLPDRPCFEQEDEGSRYVLVLAPVHVPRNTCSKCRSPMRVLPVLRSTGRFTREAPCASLRTSRNTCCSLNNA